MKKTNNYPLLLDIIKDLQNFNIPNSIPNAKEIQSFLINNPTHSYNQIIRKLKANIPLEYVLGYGYFCGTKFKTTPDVLIPRIETEDIVKRAVEYINNSNKKFTVIDVGTGSGAIIISVAKKTKNQHTYIGIDVSPKAINIAKQNAQKHKINVTFLPKDFSILASLNITPPYIILANLPYIPNNEMPSLPSSVQYEPSLALNGGKNGLDLYQKLWQIIKKLPHTPEFEMYEIHSTTANLGLRLYQDIFPEKTPQLITDCFKRNRFILNQRSSS